MSYFDEEIASALGGLDSLVVPDDGRVFGAGLLRKQVLQANRLRREPMLSSIIQAPFGRGSATGDVIDNELWISSSAYQIISVTTGPWWPGEQEFEYRVRLTGTRAGQITDFILPGGQPITLDASTGSLDEVGVGRVANPDLREQTWLLQARLAFINDTPVPGLVGSPVGNPFFQNTLIGEFTLEVFTDGFTVTPSLNGPIDGLFSTGVDTQAPIDLLVESTTDSRSWRRRVRNNAQRNALVIAQEPIPLLDEERALVSLNQPARFTLVFGGRISLGGGIIMCGRTT